MKNLHLSGLELRVIILAFFMSPMSSTFAQQYKAEYIQVINLNGNPDTAVATLLFNNNVSVYSFGKREKRNKSEDLTTDDEQSKKVHIKLRDPKGFIYYADQSDRLFTSRELLITKPVIVMDSMVRIDWKIVADSIKTIGALKCKKAIGVFRGRDYEVWYAEEIPINAGPWKLRGLPGLIVEVADTEQVFTVQLSAITTSSEIIEKPVGEEQVTQEAFVTLFKNKLQNLTKFFATTGPSGDGFQTASKSKLNVLERSLY